MNIKNVSEKFAITTDTIRYWENEGAIPKIPRDSNGYRQFEDVDIEWVKFTNNMRKSGVSIQSIAKYLKLFEHGDHTFGERKEILESELSQIENKLDELTQTYTQLKTLVDRYDSVMGGCEMSLKRQRKEDAYFIH